MPSIKTALVSLVTLLAVSGCGGREDVASIPFEATGEAQFPLPDCVADSPCLVAYRNESGLCVEDAVPGCSECVTADGKAGSARDGVCCGGCWAGAWCSEEPNANACGAGGGLCDPCDGAQMCIEGKCGWPS